MASHELPSYARAWRFHRAENGAHKHMQIESVPIFSSDKKEIPQGCCLVQIMAASLNPIDVHFASIPFIGNKIQPMPATPGSDAVGVVKLGNDPSLAVGQLVAIRLKELQANGVLATYVLTTASDVCVPVPAGVPVAQAATVGTCGITAYQALSAGGLGMNDFHQQKRIFINGGSGGTGVFQIQIAKLLGCHVTVSCSEQNRQFCLSVGADDVITYDTVKVSTRLRELAEADRTRAFDLVLDNVGCNSELYWAASKFFLKTTGVYVQVGNNMSWAEVREGLLILGRPGILGGGRHKWIFFRMTHSRKAAIQILEWMATGMIKIPIEEEMGFDDVPEAYEKLLTKRTKGKIVIMM